MIKVVINLKNKMNLIYFISILILSFYIKKLILEILFFIKYKYNL